MKIKRLQLTAIVLVAIVLVGLAVWTLESPAVLPVQSQTEIQASLLQFAKSEVTQNFTDGSGFYSFKFGLDYISNVSQGSKIELAVYCALVDMQISSSFTKGVALTLQSSSLLVDGKEDSSVRTVSAMQPGLQVYYLQNPNTSIAPGGYNITVRLIVSTVDVNFIGSSLGSTEIVSLPGIMNVSAAS